MRANNPEHALQYQEVFTRKVVCVRLYVVVVVFVVLEWLCLHENRNVVRKMWIRHAASMTNALTDENTNRQSNAYTHTSTCIQTYT